LRVNMKRAFYTSGKSKGTVGIDSGVADGELDALSEKIKYIVKGAKRVREEDKNLAGNVIDELTLTFEALMNTASSPLDQLAMQISNLNFLGMLGFGVSSAVMNAIQVPNVVAPMLYGKFGATDSIAALSKSYKDFMSASVGAMADEDGNYSITELLETRLAKIRDEKGIDGMKTAEYTLLDRRREALNRRKQDGTITRTQHFDLVGVAEGGMEKAGMLHKIAKNGGLMFHHIERLNREVTLDAAFTLRYRQLLKGGKQYHYDEEGNIVRPFSEKEMENYAFEEAVAYAEWVNDRANMNYSADVAARIFRGPIARITLQFKKYMQGMLYNYIKSFMDAKRSITRDLFPAGAEGDAQFTKAEELKKEALRSFLALTFIQTSMAGALSLPFMGVLSAIYGMTGDDDEKKDLREDLLKGLTPIVGADQALALTNGFMDAYGPIPLSGRLNLSDLFFRSPTIESESMNPSLDYLVQILGPTGGSISNVAMAGQLFLDGEVMRAFEKLLPKAFGDVFKGYRYMTEGATNLKGYQQKEMSAFEAAIATIGFGNSELNKQRLEMQMAKGAETAITIAKRDLVFDLGWQLAHGQDLDADRIDEWNEKHPEYPILMENIIRSSKGITRTEEKRAEYGYTINPKLEYLAEESNLFDDDDY